MTHLRTQIRQYIAAAIEAAGLVPTGQVYQSRVHAHDSDIAQAIEIRTPVDTIAGNVSDAPKIYRRLLAVEIVCFANGETAEDNVNTLADQIEALLLPDHSLSGLAEDVDLESTTIELDGAGLTTYAEATLGFVVRYISEHPVVISDDFNSAYVDWDMATPDAQIDAQDQLTLPQ